MKNELISLYNDANEKRTIESVRLYKEGANRIAPMIIMDLIHSDVEKDQVLKAMADAITDLLNMRMYSLTHPTSISAIEALQKYKQCIGK